MSDLLGISGNAVTAYQLALGTVSNNIANVSTDGYSRQGVDLRAATPRQVGGAYIGTGVVYDRVKRQYDAFAELNLRNSTSELSSQVPMVEYANRVVDLMGSEDAGLVSALDKFFSAARGLSTDPASSALRGEFFRSAEGVASRFGLISSQLDIIDTETREALEGNVSEINTLAQQLAAVNGQMAKHGSADRQPSELLDQRDRLLRELSQYVRIRTTFSVNGAVTVSLGASASRDLIIDGQKAVRIATVTDAQNPDRIGLVLDPYGQTPKPLTGVTSGKLAGILSFRDQVLGSSRNALDDIGRVFMSEVNALHRSGVDGYGELGGDLFQVAAGARHLAGGLQVAIDDPLRIAAAAQFRVIEAAGNTGRADATVSYSPVSYDLPKALAAVLPNNAHPAASKVFQVGGTPPSASIASISAGMKDVVIHLNDAQGDQQLQLITRDGRHLLGTPLSAEQQTSMLESAGMQPGATYEDAYRGKSGEDGYRGMQVFYGARAEVSRQQAFSSTGEVLAGDEQPAFLQGARLSAGVTTIAAGTLTLNGVALQALTVSGGIKATDVARWLDTAGSALGIRAQARNDLRVPVGQLRLDQSLTLNDEHIASPAGSFASVQDLVDAINARSTDSHLQASLTGGGELVITNTAGHEGEDIRIDSLLSSGANALNVGAGTYTGRVELLGQNLQGQDSAIELGFGASGKPSDLAKLGFRAAAYIRGTVPDDVLVFATDSSASTVQVSASYQGTAVDVARDLRAHPMQVRFIAPTQAGLLRYQITDTATGSVLAERNLDPAMLDEGIAYRGLRIAFTSRPQVNDVFALDGNRDGTGNNDNIRALASLESAKLLTGGRTFAAAYIDQVNEMGNVARQASIAKDALAVVRDQAEENRDKVAGVNLDEEAANLIRFQQAYQASAKVMQIASQLFDSMLQVK